MDVGFIGLGHMGEAIARNLLKSGHHLRVYNRTRDKAAALAKEGAEVAESPADAACHSEIMVTMLTGDEAVEAVRTGEQGALAAMKPGSLHMSMSTISVALSERLTELHREAGQSYVATPVLGRPSAAADRKLFIIAAGPKEEIARIQPLLDAIGQRTYQLDERPASANLAKLTTNFMLAAMLENLGAAFALIRKAHIDPRAYLEILTTSLFAAPAYQTYGPMIVEEKFEPAGFAMPLGLKDVRLVLQAGAALQVPMPVAGILRDHFLTGMATGLEHSEWAAIAKVCARAAGLPDIKRG
jgi:3-hydroxyisobutyrate dehydrogenase-like beta-hydroxyacid dehydrogenase